MSEAVEFVGHLGERLIDLPVVHESVKAATYATAGVGLTGAGAALSATGIPVVSGLGAAAITTGMGVAGTAATTASTVLTAVGAPAAGAVVASGIGSAVTTAIAIGTVAGPLLPLFAIGAGLAWLLSDD